VVLGLTDYQVARDLQEKLVDARKGGLICDTLLLLSHPDVITLGRQSSRQFLRLSESELQSRGISVIEAGRGGEVTFHGPGQLTAYPILRLDESERDLHGYLRGLEEVGIGVCSSFGLESQRIKGRTGVWVDGKKVAAIGVRARSWVTFHGISMNHTDELDGFGLIVPCGISDASVTCLESLLGESVPREELEKRFCHRFAEVFKRELLQIEQDELKQQLRVTVERTHNGQ
jgi:lipoyl(octanoyl) transferase